jgi:hypothetical protein
MNDIRKQSGLISLITLIMEAANAAETSVSKHVSDVGNVC